MCLSIVVLCYCVHQSTIVKCNDRFEGTEQQDSQEVLALLLGGLHEDLNKVRVG